VSKSALEPPVILRIVPWVGKVSFSYGGSQICSGSGGGGLVFVLDCWWCCLVLGRLFVGLVEDIVGVLYPR
jgi:hypothetical protein